MSKKQLFFAVIPCVCVHRILYNAQVQVQVLVARASWNAKSVNKNTQTYNQKLNYCSADVINKVEKHWTFIKKEKHNIIKHQYWTRSIISFIIINLWLFRWRTNIKNLLFLFLSLCLPNFSLYWLIYILDIWHLTVFDERN